MKWAVILTLAFGIQTAGWADSVNLFNDSGYTLNAVVYDAQGTLLGEFVLNPRDAASWSDADMNYGSEPQYAAQLPYTVNWSCMGGNPYGVCNNVASGAVVTAQGCGGAQECMSQSPASPY